MNACNVHIDIIPINHTSWYHMQHVFRYYQQFLHLVVQTVKTVHSWFLHRVWLSLKLTNEKVYGFDVTVVRECMLFIIKKK